MVLFLALLEKEEMMGRDPFYDNYPYYMEEGYEEDEEEDDITQHQHDDDGWDLMEQKYCVKSLINLDGQTVVEELSLQQHDILQDDCFEDLEPAEEDEFQGYMGNEGESKTHWYHTTAIVMVPLDSLLVYLNSTQTYADRSVQSSNVRGIVRYLADECLKQGSTGVLSHMLLGACEQAWTHQVNYYTPVLDKETTCNAMKIAVMTSNTDLLRTISRNHFGALPEGFFNWLKNWLLLQDNAAELWNGLSSAIMESLFQYPDFTKMLWSLLALARVEVEPDPEICNPEYILLTIRDNLDSILDDFLNSRRLNGKCPPLSNGNGQTMVDLSLYHEDHVFFLQHTSSKVMARIDNPAFILGFFFKLYNRSFHDSISKNEMQQMHQTYHDMAIQFISACDFTKMINTRQDIMPKNSPSVSMDVNPAILQGFFEQIQRISIGSDHLTGLLVEKLVMCAPEIAGAELDSLWIPFLQSVLHFLTHQKITASTPRYEQLFITFLTRYVKKFVGKAPRQEGSLVRRGVPCQCTDCSHLNNFLANGTQKEGRFSINQKKREHMSREIDSARVDCTRIVERGRSPFTLVVTKTFREKEKQDREWRKRSSVAREKLRKFDQKKLQKVLGDQYQNVMDLREARFSASLAALNEISPNGTSTVVQRSASWLAGGKRKREIEETEIVDLTSD